SLLLHVGAHQGAVGVVILQEGDHGGGHGDHHAGADVHVVRLGGVYLHELVPVTAHHLAVDKAALLVQGLVGLGHNELILHVGGHVDHFLGDDAGLLIHLAEGGLDEAVLIDAGKGGQVGDQADVGTFRGLDGAHAPVVGVMDVPDFETGPVPGEAARAQGGQA